MKKVAIVGSVGVPASYGGFETLVENIIGENCSVGVEYTVFCSSKEYAQKMESYRGAKLRYIPLRANGAQSVLYDVVSLVRSIRGYDVVVALGVSGGLFFSLFRLLSSARLIVNVDGVEWRRAKWGWLACNFLRLSEASAVRFASVVVGDNRAIVDYVSSEYRRPSELIAYGADHIFRHLSDEREAQILSQYGLPAHGYAITICRIEPENNCEMILRAFSKLSMPIVFIGNWSRSDYGLRLKQQYFKYHNIKILDAIYDLDILYALRSNSRCYLHGHSAGGTNPSLVEAMYCGCNILAYDVNYNRETTEGRAYYFRSYGDIVHLIQDGEVAHSNSAAMSEVAHRRYRWSIIAKQYESLYY